MIISLMILVSWTDWKTKRIPDKYIWGILGAGIIDILLFSEPSIMHRGIGILVISIPLLVLTCVVPGSIGGGDIKLMAAAGFLLGMTGVWKAFVTGMFCAGGYILFIIAFKRIDRKAEIALGPFLSIGMILEILRM